MVRGWLLAAVVAGVGAASTGTAGAAGLPMSAAALGPGGVAATGESRTGPGAVGGLSGESRTAGASGRAGASGDSRTGDVGAAAGLSGEARRAGAGTGGGELLRLGFTLVNLGSGKCLTVTAGGMADNAILIQQACGRDSAFRWRLVATGRGTFRLVNAKSAKCLTIAGDSLADNGFAVQYRCGDDPSAEWRLRRQSAALLTLPPAEGLLENSRSRKCLTIAGGSAAENGVAVQYTCDTERSRRWSIRLAAGAALD